MPQTLLLSTADRNFRPTWHKFSWPLSSFVAESAASGPQTGKAPYHSLSRPHLYIFISLLNASDLVYVGHRVGSWVGLNFRLRLLPSVAGPGSGVLLIPGSGMDFFRISDPGSSTYIFQSIGSPWFRSNEVDKRISKDIPQFNNCSHLVCFRTYYLPT